MDDGDILGGSVGRIVLADNLAVLGALPDESVDLVYIDPPFNTGKRQTLRRLKTVADPEGGDRTGFAGRRYRTIELGSTSYVDVHDDYLEMLEPRLAEIRRVLRPTGSLYLHLDAREVHYAKVLCDSIFGRESFLNEVIWAYDYGARTTRRWPPKHDNILVYVKDPDRYWFDAEAVERIPYMAPGLVGPEKAARGKLPTDTW
jgi:site-specific DNA-methyltransferase (adenine-specific)